MVPVSANAVVGSYHFRLSERATPSSPGNKAASVRLALTRLRHLLISLSATPKPKDQPIRFHFLRRWLARFQKYMDVHVDFARNHKQALLRYLSSVLPTSLKETNKFVFLHGTPADTIAVL
jgi:hypothetical protein